MVEKERKKGGGKEREKVVEEERRNVVEKERKMEGGIGEEIETVEKVRVKEEKSLGKTEKEAEREINLSCYLSIIFCLNASPLRKANPSTSLRDRDRDNASLPMWSSLLKMTLHVCFGRAPVTLLLSHNTKVGGPNLSAIMPEIVMHSFAPSPLLSPLLSLSHTLSVNQPFTRFLSLSLTLSLFLSVTLTLSISFYFLSVTQDRIWPTRHRSSKHTRNYNHNRSSTPHRPSQSHQHTPYTYTSQPSAFSLPDLERLNRDEERNSDSDSDNDINNDQYHIHNNDDDDDDDDDNNSDTSSDFYSINSVTPQPDLLHANLSTDSTFNAFQDLDLDLGMGIGLQDYNGTNPGVCPFLFNLSSSFFYLICFPPSFVKSIFFLFV